MAKKKVVTVDPNGEPAPSSPSEVKSKRHNAVTVSWRGNSRVYSREAHGENFWDLAEEFKNKRNGTLEPLA